MTVVVCGLGQSLRGDDAAGLEAVRLWRRLYPQQANRADVRVHVLEVPDLALLDVLEGAEAALLVDAAQAEAPPGSVHCLTAAGLPAFCHPAPTSAHGWSPTETIALARALGRPLPPRLDILAIVAAYVIVGADLSPAVRAALPHAAEAIAQWVEQRLSELAPHPRR